MVAEVIEAVEKKDINKLKSLIGEGFSLDKFDGNASALIRACDEGYTEIAITLIDSGADINYEDDAGDSPLICAAVIGNVSIVEKLLTKSVNVNNINRLGASALGYAKHHGKDEVVKLLEEFGAFDDE